MRIQIVTDTGVLVESIDLTDTDVTKPLAKADVWDDIVRAVEIAKTMEEEGA